MSWRGWVLALAFSAAYALIVLRTLILELWATTGDDAGVKLAAGFFVYGGMAVLAGFVGAGVFARLVWPDLLALVSWIRVRWARRGRVVRHAG